MKDAREIDKQDDFQGGVGEVVESYVAPADFEMNGETIKKGSWVLVTKASEEVWEQIKKGEITGYSMAGTAETIEKQEKSPFLKRKQMRKGFLICSKTFLWESISSHMMSQLQRRAESFPLQTCRKLKMLILLSVTC